MIPIKYLTALETEQFTLFPGEVYFKGALRKYAAELGLDAQALINSYNAEQEETADPEHQKTTLAASKPPRQTPKFDFTAQWRKLQLKRFLPIVAIVLLLLAGSFLLRKLMTKEPPQVDPPPLSTGQDEEQNDGQTETNSPEEPAVLVQSDTSTEEVHFMVSNAAELTAELSFSSPCWIRAFSDGKRSLDGTYRPGQPQVARASEEISIRLGNPPAVTLAINGQAVQLPETKYAYTITISKK